MQEQKVADVADLVYGKIPGGQQGCWSLQDAANIVRHLLAQLAGVLEALEPIAYHRDLSGHNVLVDFSDGAGPCAKPTFSLIDFGLAVRSSTWENEYRRSNLAGDVRYWCPAAWMALSLGFEYVESHANGGFEKQYVARMDHFGLGVLALETLLGLSTPSEEAPGMAEVRSTWAKYWRAVLRLFQEYHKYGADKVRNTLARADGEGVNELCHHLRHLRVALRTASMHSKNGRYAAVLTVCADLIDERGTYGWKDVAATLASEQQAASSMPMFTQQKLGTSNVVWRVHRWGSHTS